MSDLRVAMATSKMKRRILAKDEKLSERDYNTFITILVDNDEHKVNIQPAVLRMHSKLFTKECLPVFPGICGKTLRFPEVDIKTFSIFVAWCATGSLDFAKDLPEVTGPYGTREKIDQCNNALWDQLVSCYILGEKVEALEFENAIMDALLVVLSRAYYENRIACWVATEAYQIKAIFSKTDVGSRLRILLKDHILAFLAEQNQKEVVDEDHEVRLEKFRNVVQREPELVQHIVKSVMPSRRIHLPCEGPSCRYHKHHGRVLCRYRNEDVDRFDAQEGDADEDNDHDESDESVNSEVW